MSCSMESRASLEDAFCNNGRSAKHCPRSPCLQLPRHQFTARPEEESTPLFPLPPSQLQSDLDRIRTSPDSARYLLSEQFQKLGQDAIRNQKKKKKEGNVTSVGVPEKHFDWIPRLCSHHCPKRAKSWGFISFSSAWIFVISTPAPHLAGTQRPLVVVNSQFVHRPSYVVYVNHFTLRTIPFCSGGILTKSPCVGIHLLRPDHRMANGFVVTKTGNKIRTPTLAGLVLSFLCGLEKNSRQELYVVAAWLNPGPY